MKHAFKILLTILAILNMPLSGIAQQSKEFNIMKDNIESMLPPLETIIDSAIAKNPSVKFSDLQISINKYALKTSRAEWTKDLGIQTDVRYGTYDNFATNVVAGQNPSLLATRNTQTNYGAGAYIRIPFYDFVNRKNQINLAKAEVEQAQSTSMVQRNELRQLVIKQYNELIIKQRLLKIKSRYAETSRVNMEMAEKEFVNGVITVAGYSSVSEIVSKAEEEFENAKMEFRTAYMILEEIVGIRFNLTNSLNQ